MKALLLMLSTDTRAGSALSVPACERAVAGQGAVLIVCLSSGFGGADVRVLQTAKGLHGRRDYAIATLTGSPLSRKLRAAGLNAVEMGSSRMDPGLLLRFIRLIDSGRFEVVDAHNPQSQFWALLAARLTHTPVRLSTVHHVYAKSDGGLHKRLLYQNILRLNRWLGCRFIVVSKEIATSLYRLGIKKNRVLISDNAIDVGETSGAAGYQLRAELGWTSDYNVIGIFGRLAPQKGHAALLQSLARLRTEQPNLRCVVVGAGDLRPSLESLAADLGLTSIVHFTGFRDDVLDLMQAVDLVCQPSIYEGLPYTVLEAAALAKPMILTAVGGIPDHFVHGETARILAPHDVDGLCHELAWCCNNAAVLDAMGKAARTMIDDCFSLKKVLEQTCAAYDQLG